MDTRQKDSLPAYIYYTSKWNYLKQKLSNADPSKTVPLMHFEKESTTSKQGNVMKKLKSTAALEIIFVTLAFIKIITLQISAVIEKTRRSEAFQLKLKILVFNR